MYTISNGIQTTGSTIDANALNSLVVGLPPDIWVCGKYTNGTLFTDDFFNIRYLLDPSKDTAAIYCDQYKTSAATCLDIQPT